MNVRTADDVLALAEERSREGMRRFVTDLLLLGVDPDEIDAISDHCEDRLAASMVEQRPAIEAIFASARRQA